jgi:hypothetical protein
MLTELELSKVIRSRRARKTRDLMERKPLGHFPDLRLRRRRNRIEQGRAQAGTENHLPRGRDSA